MNIDELPTTVKELNAWIIAHFQVFSGPARAFVELPFRVIIGDENREATANYYHRIVFVQLGFRGEQEECCRCLAAHLYVQTTREIWEDAAEPVFIRRDFSYREDEDFGLLEKHTTGRLAFWRNELNKALLRSPANLQQGAIPNKPVMPAGWFDRR